MKIVAGFVAVLLVLTVTAPDVVRRFSAASVVRRFSVASVGRLSVASIPLHAQTAPASTSIIRIGVKKGSTYEIVSVPLEEYVARVLTGEALPGSAPAAMESLAIAVRTYTQINLGKHKADGFDLCDQTDCQVMRTATPASDRAAQATAGQVLMYRGMPANIYYSASCGGRTEVPSAVWPGSEDVPYLPSQPDEGCNGGPVWTTELALPDLRRAFTAAGYRGTLREMSVTARNSSGRVSVLRLDGLTPNEVSGQDLRAIIGRTLGWQYVRSASFDMRRSGDIYRMDGRGSGHGVGMCVIGAANFAATGQSARTILAHYYPGLDIGTFTPRRPTLTLAPPPPAPPARAPAGAPVMLPPTVSRSPARPAAPAAEGVVVSLPEGDEGEREVLLALAARERDGLAAALGVAAPPRITVRFHATTNEYERASNRPWFTMGAVVNNEIHLPPLAPLRDGGTLQKMLRRQMVHLLVDRELEQRPAWVREGVALLYGDGQQVGAAPAGAPRPGPCPSDADLMRPVSAGALSTAFSEARSCFERQIAAGRTWRDVR